MQQMFNVSLKQSFNVPLDSFHQFQLPKNHIMHFYLERTCNAYVLKYDNYSAACMPIQVDKQITKKDISFLL